MDAHRVAEELYQQGLGCAQSKQGEQRENLRRALAWYERALHYFTAEAFPEQWGQIQQDMTQVYGALVQDRLNETPTPVTRPRSSRRPHLTLLQGLLLTCMVMILLAIPATVLTVVSLEHGNPFCSSGTLHIDVSADLQPLVDAVARDYMQHYPHALITVREETSQTGLTDVERGYHTFSREDV